MAATSARAIPRELSAIPPVDAAPLQNRIFRFYASNNAIDLIVSRGDVLSLLQMATTTGLGGTMARMIQSIRINSVEIWVPPQAATAFLNMTWLSQLGRSKTVTETAIGTALPGHLYSRPPKDSLASFYSISGVNETEPLLGMDIPKGAIIDVNVSYAIQNYISQLTAPVLSSSVATVTAGVVYGFSFDGTSTNVLNPVGILQG